MVALPLTSGAYSAEGYVANAQRCVNLFVEVNPKETDPETPVTHYPRPGLKLLAQPPVPGAGRCIFGSSKDQLFVVIGQTAYYVDRDFNFTNIGSLITPATTPVSISDNGTNAIMVDGSPQGFNILLATPAAMMQQIGDPVFEGSTRSDFIDYFIILNFPGTNRWYCTLSNQIAFNGLYVGQKTAWPDEILCAIAIEREVLLLGPKKGEVWYNSGGVPFPFQILPGVMIEQGCAARYSPAKMDTNVYWLSESPEGDRMVMRMNNQNVSVRISTSAIENEFKKYPRVDDAIGSTYQINGHSFYELHFPTADKTWGYDEATKQWFEDNWIDKNGVLHRARNTFCTYAYGKNLALDWSNGNIYQIDTNTKVDQTDPDTSSPIPWIRSFPHAVAEMKQVSHSSFIADVQTGNSVGTGENNQFLSPWSSGFSSGFGPLTQVAAPVVNLRVSRDGGKNYGNNRSKGRISSGRYRSLLRWRGNGIARDMVFELSSTAEMSDALNGAYIDPMIGSA